MRTRIFAILIVVVSFGVVLGSVSIATRVWKEKEAAKAPFAKALLTGTTGTFTDAMGVPVSFDIYQGQKLVVISWASWCPQCADQLALVARIAAEASTSVPVLAINRKESREQVRAYLDAVGEEKELEYIHDTEDHFFRNAGGFAMPEVVLYGEDGNEKVHFRGVITEDELRALFSQ